MRGTASLKDTDEDRPPAPRPMLFLALEAHRPMVGGARYLLDGVSEVSIGRCDTRERRVERDGERLAIEIPDEIASRTHARMTQRGDGWLLSDLGSKNGIVVNGEVLREGTLRDGDLIEIGRTSFIYRWLPAGTSAAALDASDLVSEPEGLATLLPPLADVLDEVKRMARTPMTVLIQGETGTGKEVIARAIHRVSGRRGPLSTINCGAVTESLLESELFGARKGAYSGAEDRPGLIRAAEGGTLFLDEIGEMPLSMQVKLLRVIQHREVIPVGGTEPTRVNVRFLAATHRDLEALVREGKFREDLLARIAGFGLVLPPLRERREDLGLLIASLLPGCASADVTFDPRAARALLLYSWPRNIRELEQALGRAAGLAGGVLVRPKHLPDSVAAALDGPVPAPDTPAPRSAPPGRPTREELERLMRLHKGNISAVAVHFGKDPRQIRRWLAHHGLMPERS